MRQGSVENLTWQPSDFWSKCSSGTSCFDTLLWYVLFFFKEFWLLIAFSFSEIMAWDHLYMMWCLPCFLSVGLLMSPPWIFKMWNGWSLIIVFQTSLLLSYLQGLSKTLMNAWPVRNTATRRHSILLKHNISLKISVNKEPWCFHCNQKFASLFKNRTVKKTASNQIIKRKQHQSIKEKQHQFIYLHSKKKEKFFPLLKIFKSRELKGGLDHRHEISNHGLAMLFLRLKTCLLSYSHPFQPEEVEGAQDECQS